MGCVSSNLLNHDDDFTQLGSSALSQHIVSLTSTTYGLLTLDPPPQHSNPTTPPPPTTPPTRFTLGSIWSEPRHPAEVINSWELMAGLENNTDSFRFFKDLNKENSNPNTNTNNKKKTNLFDSSDIVSPFPKPTGTVLLDKFERKCPPNGENKVVLYTTSLRGVRKTFEACNAVRAVLQGLGVLISERDISMDRGFREELGELMKGKEREAMVPPRLFVKGRYVGGSEELLKIVEEGWVGELLQGLPKKRGGCEGCGDVRFLPCFQCSGSCKMVMVVKEEVGVGQRLGRSTVVVRCPDCNENGLVLCPICS
uniref:Glutaredoxin domain-containing protein n=1 Tax=Fagus sylvatica TaxID=28930 RepID=A0A2N9ECK3_FAGSY